MNKKFAGLMAVTIMAVGIGFFAISNVAHAASTSTLNVIFFVDNSAGGTASPSDFSVNATGVLGGLTVTSTFPGGSSPTAITVDADTPYSVSVSSLPNYTLENFSDCSGTTAPAGSSVGCVITEQFVSTSTSCVATTTYQNPSLAQLTIASSAIGETLGASTTNDLVGAWTFTAYNSPVLLNSIKFTVIGSASDSNLQNVKLVVNGTQVGATLSSVAQNGTASFTASSGTLATLTTGNNDIQLFADVVGSPSKNFQFEIANASDVSAADGHYCNAPIQTNANDGTLITIEQGQLTTTQDPTTPSGNIPVGEASVTLAKFDLYATNEPLNLKFLDFNLNLTGVSASTTLSDQIQNVSLFDENGVQIGSTIHVPPSGNTCTAPIALSGYTSLGSGNSTITNSNVTYADCFGTPSSPISYTIPMNATTVLYLKADIETTANFDTVRAALSGDTDNLQGASSDATSSMSAADANVLTLVKTEMVASPNSALGTPSVSAGASDVEIGSYAISASVAEGINVNSASVELSPQGTANSPSDIFQNLKLMVNGTQFGATQSVLAQGATYTFSGTPFNIPASGTVDVDVYADILSSATSSFASEYQPATLLDGVSGTGVITNNTISSSILTTGQNLSLGGGGGGTPAPSSTPTISNLGQIAMDGTILGEGAIITDNAIFLNGTLVSPVGNHLQMQIEVQPSSSAFTGIPNATSSFVISGMIAPAAALNLPSGQYHWQARAVDSQGNASTWKTMSNPPVAVDFNVVAYPLSPYPYGFSFENYQTDSSHMTASDTLYLFQKAFDFSMYPASEAALLASSSYEYVSSVDPSIFDGDCYGFSTLAAFLYGKPNYVAAHFNGLETLLETSSIAGLPWNLPEPAMTNSGEYDGSNIQSKPVLAAILSAQLQQLGDQAQIAEQNSPATPSGILAELQSNLSDQTPDTSNLYVLTIRGKESCGFLDLGECSVGHAVLPYKVVGNKIYIYDPNNSAADNTGTGSAYNDYVQVNSNGTATLDSPKDGFMSIDSMWLLPLDTLYNNNKLPTISSSTFITGNANLAFEDNSGNLSGYFNGQMYNQIPGVVPIVPFSVPEGGVTSTTQIPTAYWINTTASLQTIVQGNGTGTYSLTSVGNGYFANVSGLASTPSSTDTFSFSSTTITVSPSVSSGTLDIILDGTSDGQDHVLTATTMAVASTTYTYSANTMNATTPTATPAAGTYSSPQSVVLATSNVSSTIYYTTDGTTPTCSTGTIYSSPISVNSSETINAISCYATSTPSDVASFAYTINIPPSSGGSSVAVASGGGGGGGYYTPIPSASTSTNGGGVVLGASTTNSVALEQELQNLEQQFVTLEFKANSCSAVFNRNLSKGMMGSDVKNLQTVLNYTPLTQVAATGAGSPNDESTYFGNATKNAVIAFQNIFANQILAPIGLTSGNGYVGSATRAVLNGLCGQR